MNFTLGQFIDAMEKNGLPQEFEAGLVGRDQDDLIVSACAIGQGFYNLGIYFNGSYNEENRESNRIWGNFYERVAHLNDIYKMPLQHIVDLVRLEFADKLNTEFTTTDSFEHVIGRVKVPA